jgi:hypothetical protein
MISVFFAGPLVLVIFTSTYHYQKNNNFLLKSVVGVCTSNFYRTFAAQNGYNEHDITTIGAGQPVDQALCGT